MNKPKDPQNPSQDQSWGAKVWTIEKLESEISKEAWRARYEPIAHWTQRVSDSMDEWEKSRNYPKGDLD